MSPRNLGVGSAVGVSMVLLALAASSGPVRVWTTPPVDVGAPPTPQPGPAHTVAPAESLAPRHSADQPWGPLLSQLVGALLILVIVTLVVWFVRSGRWPRTARGRRRDHRTRSVVALPEVADERELTVDLDAARLALDGGTPRNAIVACWMQLERDAAAAGMPRAAAETSAEYVERVVATSSVDPAPIGALAVLYREARFSRHELGDDHRTRAVAALDRVAAALRNGVKVPG